MGFVIGLRDCSERTVLLRPRYGGRGHKLRPLSKAPAHNNSLTREPCRVFRGEKDCGGSDIARLARAAKRGLRDCASLEIGAGKTGAVRTFGFDESGVQRIDPDLL